jgi:hypothetical protein
MPNERRTASVDRGFTAKIVAADARHNEVEVDQMAALISMAYGAKTVRMYRHTGVSGKLP